MIKKRKKPKWGIQGKYLKRIKDRWRKPRGRHNKLRHHKKSKGVIPSVGYGNPKEVKGLHPSGFREILVQNVSQLSKVDSKKEAVRIASAVGKKKRTEMLKKAEELKLKILNR